MCLYYLIIILRKCEKIKNKSGFFKIFRIFLLFGLGFLVFLYFVYDSADNFRRRSPPIAAPNSYDRPTARLKELRLANVAFYAGIRGSKCVLIKLNADEISVSIRIVNRKRYPAVSVTEINVDLVSELFESVFYLSFYRHEVSIPR